MQIKLCLNCISVKAEEKKYNCNRIAAEKEGLNENMYNFFSINLIEIKLYRNNCFSTKTSRISFFQTTKFKWLVLESCL